MASVEGLPSSESLSSWEERASSESIRTLMVWREEEGTGRHRRKWWPLGGGVESSSTEWSGSHRGSREQIEAS